MRAALHDDMLQQAVDLLQAGYHVAAMVLAGGVVENRLRILCEARNVLPQARNLNAYNQALRDVAYAQATWRRL